MKELKGVIPIMQAPFLENDEVDYESLRALTRSSIEDGCTGLALFGFATEFYKLSPEEKIRMTETVADAAGGRVPVIASVTSNSTILAVREAKNFAAAGADAIMMFSPQVIPTPIPQLVEHIKAVGSSTPLPFVVQYTPALAGGALTPEALCEVGAYLQKPFYIKAEPQPPHNFVTALQQKSKGTIGIFAGNQGTYIIDLMDRGVSAVMPGCSTLKPYVKLYRAYASGDREAALSIYEKMMSFIATVNLPGGENFIYLEKLALNRRGIIKNPRVRHPAVVNVDEQFCQSFLSNRERMLRALDCRD